MTVILELRQPLWMKTPYGEALAILLTDYGPESDHLWTCIQQEGEHQGELWTWHNSEVRVLPNSSMLRRPLPEEFSPRLADAAAKAAADPNERTIGEVIQQVKDEAGWATRTQQPPMRNIQRLRHGDMIPHGYRQIQTAQWGTVLLRIDLPDSYPDDHPDEIPK